MKRLACLVMLATYTATAWADRYGIDEAMSESEVGTGAIMSVIALLIYLHFKGPPGFKV